MRVIWEKPQDPNAPLPPEKPPATGKLAMVLARAWYILLVALPFTFGQSDLREGGEFLPGFLMGLAGSLILFLVVEGIRRAIRA